MSFKDLHISLFLLSFLVAFPVQATQPDSWVDPTDKVYYEEEQEILQQLGEIRQNAQEKETTVTIVRAAKVGGPKSVEKVQPLVFRRKRVVPQLPPSIPVQKKSENEANVARERGAGIPAQNQITFGEQELVFGGITIRNDMPIALVSVKEISLVTGPGEEFMGLSSIPMGTRVAIETRNDDWYRVITEDGLRGWIPSDVVLFGPDSRTLPTRYIKVQGVDSRHDRNDWEEDSK